MTGSRFRFGGTTFEASSFTAAKSGICSRGSFPGCVLVLSSPVAV